MATYTYSIEGTAIPVTAGKTLAFSLNATTAIRINSITIYGICSSYTVDGDVQDIHLSCNIGGSYTLGGHYEDVEFTVNQTYSAGQSISVTISTSTNAETFELAQGLAQIKILTPDGAAGILNTSTSNIPKFAVNYTILDDGYYRDDDINDGYPFLQGLLTNYGDYHVESDWYIDESGIINDGYPFLQGLLTDYGDYIGGKSKIYYNGRQCPLYYNGRQCKIYYNNH